MITYGVYLALVIAFWVALYFAKDESKRWLHWLAFALPLIWLVTFKIEHWLPLIGVSYMAFRLSYLLYEIDSGRVDTPNLQSYLGFAFFTPTFLVGPINPYNFYETSLNEPNRDRTPLFRSFTRLIIGTLKLVVIGSLFKQLGFFDLLSDGAYHNLLDFFAAALFFFFYLYFNFSGLNDIGIGAAGIMKIKVKENFDSPFTARNLSEFWNRWHITLGHYMRDVFFNPLSMTLVRNIRFISPRHLLPIATMITFALIGVWHGNGWEFLALGLLHGIGIVIVQYYGLLVGKTPVSIQKIVETNLIYRWIATGLTITYVSLVSTLMVLKFEDISRIFERQIKSESNVLISAVPVNTTSVLKNTSKTTKSNKETVEALFDPMGFAEGLQRGSGLYFPKGEVQKDNDIGVTKELSKSYSSWSRKIHGYPVKISIGQKQDVQFLLSSKKSKANQFDGYVIFDATTENLVADVDLKKPSTVEYKKCLSNRGDKGCDFQHSLSLPADKLKDGAYVVLLKYKGDFVSDELFFIKQPDLGMVKKGTIAVVHPTYTWQAYNSIGGASFYTLGVKHGQHEVSLLRPLKATIQNDYHSYRGTVPFARKIQELGMTPLHLTNADLHNHPELKNKLDLLILTSHDEYMSSEMRDFIDGVLSRDKSIAVFSGNVSWWKINVIGDRLLVKKGNAPVSNKEFNNSGYWFNKKIDRESQNELGLTYYVGGMPVGRVLSIEEALSRGLTKTEYRQNRQIKVASAHPIFDGTGLTKGDWFGKNTLLLDIEMDTAPLRGDGEVDRTWWHGFPEDMKVLGTGFVVDKYFPAFRGRKKWRILHSAMIAETKPEIGGKVIHFGSIGWFGAIDAQEPRASKIVENTIKYLIK
nr:N,N-dimethylformamidase beta subunit family domain-containing protein [Pseudoalteromonas sp. C2R02]